MSAPMTDIPTSKTTNPTNLYTTRKSTNFYIYDGKEITQISRPCESKVMDGEKPDNALHPSVIAIPDLATESRIERSIVITHDDKYQYVQDDCIFIATKPTQFNKNILKDPSYQITSTSLFIALSSLTSQEIEGNMAENDCKVVIGFDGDKYLKITPTSNLKTIADKALNDAIERNDGDNRGTATDTVEFIIIKLCGVKGKYIFRTTYSSLILPSLSQDDDKYEKFVLGVSFLNAPGIKTRIQIIPCNTTFTDYNYKPLGALAAGFQDPIYLSTSSNPFVITNVGINHAMAIMNSLKKKPSVSFASSSTITFCGKGKLAVLDIDLREVSKATNNQLTDYELIVCNDNSGSMYSYVDIRNNTNLGLNEKLFNKLEDLVASGSIDKATMMRIVNMAFDSELIPEWSIEESIVFDSDNILQKLKDTKKKFADTINKQGARGSTNFANSFNSTRPNKSVLFITDGYHNGSSEEALLDKINNFCKSAKCLYIALMGIGPYAYVPLLQRMAKVVHDNGHTCDVFSSTFFPGSDKVDPEINTDYNSLVDKFTSILFEQNTYNIVLPEGCKIIHANMNNHTIDGNKISFKASGGSIKVAVEYPTDNFNITVNDRKISCDILKQDNPFPMLNYIVSREFYTDPNNKDDEPRIKSVNDWLIANYLTSCRVSSVYEWIQDFGGEVAKKDEVAIPTQNTTPIIPTPISTNTVLTTLINQVKDLNDEIEETEDNNYSRARGGVTRGVTRGVASGVTRSATRGITRGSMQAVFTQVEPNKKQSMTVFIKPIEILKIQDLNNFLTFNNTCYGEWTWYHIMNYIDITTYELLKKSHAVIAMIIDLDMKFKTIMNFKLHITNTINNLISIFENLNTTKSDYDDIFISHSTNIITTYSSVIDTIILDVARLKLNFTQYQDEFKVLSSNEHIIAATQDTYLYDIFATQQTNHTTLITLIESFDKEIMLCPMKDKITKLFTPKIDMSL
jgi:hypothetical protein